jgi:hypothetical protein
VYKIATFINLDYIDRVRDSMFEAGGGRIGNYDSCCFETKGTGQFRALEGSTPYIGSINEVELVEEVKIEMVVADDSIKDVIKAMKSAHPYETPAYDVIKLEDL